MLQTISIIITTTIAVIGGMYALLTKVFKLGEFKQHFKDFELNTNNKFEQVDRRFDKIDQSLSEIRKDINTHENRLTKIEAIIAEKFPGTVLMFSGKYSPRRLNERGLKIFNEINGQQFLNDNKEALFSYIDNLKPLTKLDVETGSVGAVISLTSSPVFNYIKDYVYELPALDMDNGKKYELTLGDVCAILSLPLRDMYIEAHNM